jgi:hypothetical protein
MFVFGEGIVKIGLDFENRREVRKEKSYEGVRVIRGGIERTLFKECAWHAS